jgi:hypothetical protein
MGRVCLGRESSGHPSKTTANCFGRFSGCLVGARVRGACSGRSAHATVEAQNKAINLGRGWVRRSGRRGERNHYERVGADSVAPCHDTITGRQSHRGTESIAIAGQSAAKQTLTKDSCGSTSDIALSIRHEPYDRT